MYVLLSKIGPYKIFFSDIHNTGPQKELESEVINAYLTLLVKKFNKKSSERAFVIDSYEMTKIWQQNKPKIKMDPGLYKYLVGVVNKHHHWVLVVMIPGERRSLFLDSLGESKMDISHCSNISRSFMRLRGLNVSRWACDTVAHPIQQDTTSCGVYALKFAECILSGYPVVFDNSAKTLNAIREQIAVCLLENTDDLTGLCHLCGLTYGDTHWIGCDLCPRWYHQNCLNKPPKGKKEKYICAACL